MRLLDRWLYKYLFSIGSYCQAASNTVELIYMPIRGATVFQLHRYFLSFPLWPFKSVRLFFFFFFFFLLYLFTLREGETAREGQTQRERKRIPSRLCTVSAEPGHAARSLEPQRSRPKPKSSRTLNRLSQPRRPLTALLGIADIL